MGPQPSTSSVSSRFGLCAPKSTKSSPPRLSAAPKAHSDKRQSQDPSLPEVWSGSGCASMAPRVSLPQANCAEQLETEREHTESVRGEWRGRECGTERIWGGGGGARTGREHMCGVGGAQMGELEGGADGRECTGERSVRARGRGCVHTGAGGHPVAAWARKSHSHCSHWAPDGLRGAFLTVTSFCPKATRGQGPGGAA